MRTATLDKNSWSKGKVTQFLWLYTFHKTALYQTAFPLSSSPHPTPPLFNVGYRFMQISHDTFQSKTTLSGEGGGVVNFVVSNYYVQFEGNQNLFQLSFPGLGLTLIKATHLKSVLYQVSPFKTCYVEVDNISVVPVMPGRFFTWKEKNLVNIRHVE